MSAPRQGALLVNLGTPDAPTTAALRRYLREFLGDPRVLDLPAPLRWLLLNLVILPRRPRRSAEAYAKIWTEVGSPLLLHSRALLAGVRERLGDALPVALGMRYGSPSITEAVAELVDAGVRRVVVLPLFPQYAEAATGSALARVREVVAARPEDIELVEIASFHDDPGLIAAWSAVAGERLRAFDPDHVLLSYHGLPERQVTRADETNSCLSSETCCEQASAAMRGCYRAQCFATTRALCEVLPIEPSRASTCFQSRLGRTPWIRPHTDAVLPQLAERGVRRLAVLCPAFVADNLETLEEIGMQARDQWEALGGEAFELLPCPNADPVWVDAVSALLRQAGETKP